MGAGWHGGQPWGGSGAVYPQAWFWIPWHLSTREGSVFSLPPRSPQKPQRLLTRDPEEERAGRTQKGRLQQHTTLLTQMEPPAAMATGAEQASQRAKEFKNLAAIHSVQSGPGAGSQRCGQGLEARPGMLGLG